MADLKNRPTQRSNQRKADKTVSDAWCLLPMIAPPFPRRFLRRSTSYSWTRLLERNRGSFSFSSCLDLQRTVDLPLCAVADEDEYWDARGADRRKHRTRRPDRRQQLCPESVVIFSEGKISGGYPPRRPLEPVRSSP